MIAYAIARADALGGIGESLKGALVAVEQERAPIRAEYRYDWLPCYIELVRHEGPEHWAIRTAWGQVMPHEDGTPRGESLGHLADYLITASPPHRIIGQQSCE